MHGALRNGCAVLALSAWPMVGACTSAQAPGASGADCYRLEDCREGLVCIKNHCSNRLDQIAGKSPTYGTDAQAALKADAAADGASGDGNSAGKGAGGASGGSDARTSGGAAGRPSVADASPG